jgi:AmiR/NasT family two-component response regulator
LQDQAARETRIRDVQLQNALDSRVVIEQAKGMLCQSGGLELGASFDMLRQFARLNNLRLTRVAEQVVAGTLTIGMLTAPHKAKSR